MRKALVAFIKQLLCIIPADATDTDHEESNDDWEGYVMHGLPYPVWQLITD